MNDDWKFVLHLVWIMPLSLVIVIGVWWVMLAVLVIAGR